MFDLPPQWQAGSLSRLYADTYIACIWDGDLGQQSHRLINYQLHDC